MNGIPADAAFEFFLLTFDTAQFSPAEFRLYQQYRRAVTR